MSPSAPVQDSDYMHEALQLAAEAAAFGEVPVGAVVVKDGVIIGRGRNHPIQSADPTAHAEVAALRAAATALGNYRLDGCTLYVTLEPCAMCCGAILHGRIRRVVFGALDSKSGCAGSVLNLFEQDQLNHQTTVQGGVLASEATLQLQDFFLSKRALQRQVAQPLREDALRTSDVRFANLPNYPWPPHYLTDLPCLAGLRMHFIDEGPRSGAPVVLMIHAVPGWSYSLHAAIAQRLGQGMRVVVPDLVGFGKSDKPKRADFYTLELHVQSLVEWIEALDLSQFTVLSPNANQPLVSRLMERVPQRVVAREIEEVSTPDPGSVEQAAWNAPYPDTGHRAGERAWASMGLRSPIMPP
jgi:tRNA(adenine34) deaminase